MALIFVIFVTFLCQNRVEAVRTNSFSEKNDNNFAETHKTFTKKPLKTILVGHDKFDCIHLETQPGLDHPLLKNHKIQMKPTYQPEAILEQTRSIKKGSRATLESVNCPEGTIPIQRINNVDLVAHKHFRKTHDTYIRQNTVDHPGEHIVSLRPGKNTTYYGAHALFNLYDLELKSDQSSSAQMWIESGSSGDQYTSIQTGWMVSPTLGGDNKKRLFIYWTTDNSKTGCYNRLCPGYVQVDRQYGPGSHIVPASTYGDGYKQFDIELAIFQDNSTGNWWLQYNGTTPLGYWPKEVVPQLNLGASLVAWGGLVIAPPIEESPPMGNGHYPHGDFSKACYIIELSVADSSNHLVQPDENGMLSLVDNRVCYGLEYHGKRQDQGLAMLFGGPGGKCGLTT